MRKMGLGLEEYRARIGTWNARVSLRSAVGRVRARGDENIIGAMTLCAAVIATLLVIGGVELNPGPVDNVVKVLCSGCEKSLKSGTQCDLCGRWFHNSCGNVKVQVAESGRWNCERCRSERLRVLEEKLRDAQIQIDELKRRNRALEERLQMKERGKYEEKRDIGTVTTGRDKLLVLGDSIVRNVGAGKSNMRVECYPGIRSDQLQRAVEYRTNDKRGPGDPDAVVIHVGTNDLDRTKNLDHVMGDIYDLINTAKTKFSSSRVILSGVLRRRDVSWRRIGAANDRLGWVANTLGVTFVDPNSWVDDWGFSGDGLHLNRRGAQQLGQLFKRVCGTGGGGHEKKGT